MNDSNKMFWLIGAVIVPIIVAFIGISPLSFVFGGYSSGDFNVQLKNLPFMN